MKRINLVFVGSNNLAVSASRATRRSVDVLAWDPALHLDRTPVDHADAETTLIVVGTDRKLLAASAEAAASHAAG